MSWKHHIIISSYLLFIMPSYHHNFIASHCYIVTSWSHAFTFTSSYHNINVTSLHDIVRSLYHGIMTSSGHHIIIDHYIIITYEIRFWDIELHLGPSWETCLKHFGSILERTARMFQNRRSKSRHQYLLKKNKCFAKNV